MHSLHAFVRTHSHSLVNKLVTEQTNVRTNVVGNNIVHTND